MFIETDGAKCQGHALRALMPDDYFALDDIGRITSTSGEVQQKTSTQRVRVQKPARNVSSSSPSRGRPHEKATGPTDDIN